MYFKGYILSHKVLKRKKKDKMCVALMKNKGVAKKKKKNSSQYIPCTKIKLKKRFNTNYFRYLIIFIS